MECCDEDGSEWESDCGSDFSISDSDKEEEEEDETIEKVETKKQECPKVKQPNIVASPKKVPNTGQVKKPEQPKTVQATKPAISKKPVEVTNFNPKGLGKTRG